MGGRLSLHSFVLQTVGGACLPLLDTECLPAYLYQTKWACGIEAASHFTHRRLHPTTSGWRLHPIPRHPTPPHPTPLHPIPPLPLHPSPRHPTPPNPTPPYTSAPNQPSASQPDLPASFHPQPNQALKRSHASCRCWMRQRYRTTSTSTW